ncbi:flagellin [Sporosalibacterium faouarense]|uniref:flagellin N-terminal helical domain-containing protein n=1 Tax=Sporosalibacterium faouarense TaxID=516123 RepID=UPI00192C10C3|nr:flagellin [Sporosalibacterium faouarense]
MRINHNIQALNTYKQLTLNQNKLSKHLERLSSGLRINRAADDAAGLAISEKMRSQIRGLKVADRNSLDGISMVQTAEGSLNESLNILQRMRELAIQASNGPLEQKDRLAIQSEIDQLTFELDRISDTTNFNGKALLAGNIQANSYMVCSSLEVIHNGGGNFSGNINNNEETYLSFLDSPVAGDNLSIDDVTFNFASGTSSAYNIGTKSATIDIQGKSVADILNNIKTEIDSAKALDPTAIDNMNGYSVMGNSLVVQPNNLYIEYNDSDYAPRPDEELVLGMQIGANENEDMLIKISNMDAASLGIARQLDHTTVISTAGVNAEAGVDVSSSQSIAGDAIDIIDSAITKVIEQRSKLGAYQNRLDHTLRNLNTAEENLTAAESRIRDADMALEMTGFTQANIVNQAATAMLAQANQMPQGVLQLLQ